jgi:hypothetical protein
MATKESDMQPQWRNSRFEYHQDANGIIWQRRLGASLWWRMVMTLIDREPETIAMILGTAH